MNNLSQPVNVALIRAITEAVQSRLSIISGTRDNLFDYCYQQRKKRPNFDLHVDLREGVTMPTQNLLRAGIKEILVYDHTREAIFEKNCRGILSLNYRHGLRMCLIEDLTRYVKSLVIRMNRLSNSTADGCGSFISGTGT